MKLNQQDMQYATDPSVRIRTRFFVAFLVGIFASWKWLFIICGFFALGEFSTMFKIMRAIGAPDDSATEEQKGEHTGYAFSKAFICAVAAGLSVIAVASSFRLVKLGIMKLF